MTQPNTQGQEPVQILGCPFCGSLDVSTTVRRPAVSHCEDCGACGPEKFSPTVAIAAWNRRAQTVTGSEELDWQSVAMWLGFSASVIKSGEPWTAQCQQHHDEAKAAFGRLAALRGDQT